MGAKSRAEQSRERQDGFTLSRPGPGEPHHNKRASEICEDMCGPFQERFNIRKGTPSRQFILLFDVV